MELVVLLKSLRRAGRGGLVAPPAVVGPDAKPKYLGGQFIPAALWKAEKQKASDGFAPLLVAFAKDLDFLRQVQEQQAALRRSPAAGVPILPTDMVEQQMKAAITDSYRRAFELGKRMAGNLMGITADDEKVLAKTREDEFSFLTSFLADIENQSGIMPYAERMRWYAFALRELSNIGFVLGDLSNDRVISWNLGPTEHCFPAGVLIETPAGAVPIETISVGDLVTTLNGPKRVTRLYRNNFKGRLVTIRSHGRKVDCTPGHPFLTKRGWVNADQIRSTDEVMLLKDGFQKVDFHVAFPYPDDGVSAGSEIRVSGVISLLLGKLPVRQILKSRMAVPIVPVGLDDEFSDPDVDNKFVFDAGGRFVGDLEFIKVSPQLQLEAANLFFLNSLLSLNKAFRYACNLFWMGFAPISELLFTLRALHRIVFAHIGLSTRVNDPVRSNLVQDEVKHVSFIANLNQCLSQHGRNFRSSVRRIMRFEKIGVRLVPESAQAPSAFVGFPFVGYMAAFRTFATAECSLGVLTDVPVSANDSTESADFGSGPGLFKLFPTEFTNELRHDNAPLNRYSCVPMKTETTVYNLEVEDEHHYVANGFVVHNCNDCLAMAGEHRANDFAEIVRRTGWVPQSGHLECRGFHCQCGLSDNKGSPTLALVSARTPIP